MKILIAQEGRRWNRETHRSIAKVSLARTVESLPAPGSNVPQIKGWPFNERGSGFFARLKTVYHPHPFASLSLKFILRCFSYLSALGGGDWRGCCFCTGGLNADCTFDCVET